MRYHGGVTVGSPGRARLHDRDGGLHELIWDALGQAGWLGQTAHLRPIIDLVIQVVPAPAGAVPIAPRFAPRPGRRRREGERGWVADDGRLCQAYEGPLHGRAAAGVRLVEGEWNVEDFDAFEDMLYTAAMCAGWVHVANQSHAIGEVPDVEVRIRIARQGQ